MSVTTGTVSKYNMKISSNSYKETNEFEGLPIIKSQSKYSSHLDNDYMYEDDYDFQSSNMANLRTKTVDTKSKMGHHRDLIDRYLPVDMGPNSEVKYDIEDKYNQIATREGEMNGYGYGMHDLDSYQIHHDPFEQPQPTVKPYSPALRPKEDPKEMEDRQKQRKNQKHYLGRPPVSDIRKNCRSVICKSHGDPRWYSY